MKESTERLYICAAVPTAKILPARRKHKLDGSNSQRDPSSAAGPARREKSIPEAAQVVHTRPISSSSLKSLHRPGAEHPQSGHSSTADLAPHGVSTPRRCWPHLPPRLCPPLPRQNGRSPLDPPRRSALSTCETMLNRVVTLHSRGDAIPNPFRPPALNLRNLKHCVSFAFCTHTSCPNMQTL